MVEGAREDKTVAQLMSEGARLKTNGVYYQKTAIATTVKELYVTWQNTPLIPPVPMASIAM